jgi:hypothetical protein
LPGRFGREFVVRRSGGDLDSATPISARGRGV